MTFDTVTFDTVTFISDYGTADEFVGVCHSVIRSIAPGVSVIDLSHEIPRHDVRAGGLLLARSAQYLCPGVVLAVVDPGVGTDRRAVAIEVGDGESVLVGPDNGVLAPAVAMVGGATLAVELTSPDHRLEAPGSTFDGRDVFAPAAAHICSGVSLSELGPELDPHGLTPGILPVIDVEDDTIVSEVLWVDGFGNAQLNVDPEDLADHGVWFQMQVGDDHRRVQTVTAYEDLGQGEIGLVIDSYGLLSVATPRGSAADELGLHPTVEVRLTPTEAPRGASSPVELRGREGP